MMKRYCIGILRVARAYQLRFFRDKTALFFTFLFPLMFLLIFGSMVNNSDVSFSLALVDEADTNFSRQFRGNLADVDVLKIDDSFATIEQAQQAMRRGEVDSVVLLPHTFGDVDATGKPSGQLEVQTGFSSEQAGQTVAAIMGQILANLNEQVGQPKPSFGVTHTVTGGKGVSRFDHTLAGLLGFTILGSAIFGLASVMTAEKQRGSFRRLRAAPFRASQLVIGNGLHYLAVTMLSLLLMVGAAVVVFGFEMRGSWLQLAVFAVLAAAMMIGFGLTIGGWARNENQAAPLANLIAFPLMFLSGIFFPRFLFPEWLQNMTSYVPLSPVVDGFRKLITEEGVGLLQLGPELLMIGVWAIVVYALAFRLFRWE
ncbi:hypothetical protein CR983_02050 [Candidatus Saccharibacteria bacterium]|nr:MAG: hypothetical protein CR983_02050 [Candidatus Saccharibacteria bacterium]